MNQHCEYHPDKKYKYTGYDFIASLLLSIPFTLAYGWIVGKLWTWLLVPAGLPVVDYRVFVGVWWISGFLLSRLFMGRPERLASQGSPVFESIGFLIVMGGLSLGMGKLLSLLIW